MSDTVKVALIALVGVIAGAVVTGAIGWKQYELQREQLELQRDQAKKDTAAAVKERDSARMVADRYRQLYDDAPKKFALRLQELIDRAEAERNQGLPNVVVNAKTIVSVRDGLRSSLESLRDRLDSEIDQLARELSKPKPDERTLAQILEVLKRKWPAKKDEIELAVRKVQTELGLVPEGVPQSAPTPPGGGGAGTGR